MGDRQTRNSNPYQAIDRTKNRGTAIDTHDILRNEIYKQTGKEVAYNTQTFTASVNSSTVPGVGLQLIELYFDSARKTSSSNQTAGILSFNIPSINNTNSVTNCIALRILPFQFPRLLPGTATGQPDIWFYQRAFMRISGLPVQAVMASGNSTHHFEFKVGTQTGLNNVMVDMEPVGTNGEAGIFRLNKPQTTIPDEFQVQFLRNVFTTNTASLTPISLPTDVLVLRSVPNTNPAQFDVIGPPGVDLGIIFGQGPNLVYPYVLPAPGIAIYIVDYTSIYANTDAIVNSSFGHFVTSIINDPVTTLPTRIIVSGIDLTDPPIPAPPNPIVICQACVAMNRVAFRMQFICITSGNTNFTQMVQT